MSKSGERYKTKKDKMMHEKGEGKKERMMEYGAPRKGDYSSKRKACS
jgi:hypothetical protein